jgi:hypothetical protein
VEHVVSWDEAAREGARLFNRRHFFECHDVWEEIWIRKAGPERTFYQGLIQIAVGLYKIDVGNQSGARSLLKKGIDKLESVLYLKSPLDIPRLLSESKVVLEKVEELGQARLGELSPALIPELHDLEAPDAD